MGIVLVLLLGEIDLSAGTASGLDLAAVLALHLGNKGNLLAPMGSTVFYGFVITSS